MSDFGNKYLKEFDDKTLRNILVIFSVSALAIILYAFVFSGFQIVDEFEHLHASWLVSTGRVPYRDFFEHHHPLMWFLSAPLVWFYFDDLNIFYVMRGISFIISCATLFYVYKITQFWGSKNSGIFAVFLSLANIITIYNFYQYRPDVYMNFTFILGGYYWLLYLRTQKDIHLTVSFICFALSLLFLQKIALMLCVVEGILMILWFQKKIKLISLIKAALPALMLGLLFFFYLYHCNALMDYFNFNYRFNKAMLFYFNRGAFWIQNIALSIYGFALLTALIFFKKKNIYFKIAAILFGAEFLMRVFYFSPHPNYYTLLTFLAALILSVWLDVLMPKHKILMISVLVAAVFQLNTLLNTITKTSEMNSSYNYYKQAEYIHKNSKTDDYLMNGYDMNFNVYRKDVSFYWFGLDMLLPIIEQEFGIEQKTDINDFILKYKPRFVYAVNYPDLRAYRTYGERTYSQVFEPIILDDLYQETPFENLLILK